MVYGLIGVKCVHNSNDKLSDLGFCSMDELKHESCEIETLRMRKFPLIIVMC